MKNISKQKLKNKKVPKKLLIAGAVAVLAIATGGGVWYFSRDNAKDNADGLTGINYAPATEEEKKETEAHKKEVAKRMEDEAAAPNTPTTGNSVTPVITNSGQDPYSKALEVGAYIPTIYEDGGLCTLTLTKDSSVVSETKTAIKNVSDTTCGIISIDYSRLSPGSWQAVVSYKSNTASGSSSSMALTVQ